MNAELNDIIAQVPGWAGLGPQDLAVEQLEGLTNQNYSVTVNGERFVVRISGKNTQYLGIQRALESQVLSVVSQAGLGPQVVRFFPEGHLVKRYIEGRHWTAEEYRTPANLRRIVETVKRLHSLPAVRATFSPFRRVEAFARQAQSFGVPFPEDWPTFVEKARAIEAVQLDDASPWLRFCHNDLFWVNWLDDGSIKLLDWEFAGMGDIYFDLATLVYAYESVGPLPAELEEFLLECYLGEVHPEHRARLKGMEFMVQFFAAMWGMLQNGLQRAGLVPVVSGFDYLEYAQATFAAMRE